MLQQYVLLALRCLIMNNPNKAVFFDRDGVINKERTDYVKTLDELEVFPNVVNCVIDLKKAGFLVVIVTNQSAINRGKTTEEHLSKIHNSIQSICENNGTKIDGFYFCPHRPDENCNCRKPKPGLLLKAAQELNIDLRSSWLIGNNDSDVQAGVTVGCRSIKIVEQSELPSIVQKIMIESSNRFEIK